MSTSESNRKRECIFLDSNDPSMPVLQYDSISPSFIKLPFPPHIDLYKLILDKNQDNSIDRIPARTPNAFILYRKIFIESAQKEGYHLPMTVISSMASKSWKRESNIVKDEYKRISKQAFEIRNQLFPKSERKKKKERWNFVSFSKKPNLNDNSIKLEMKISGNQLHHQNKDIQQKKLVGNFDSFNPSFEMFPSELSPNNVKESLPDSNYQQIYDQNPENYTNLMHNSYISQNDNKFEISHSNTTNMYVENQLNNNITYTTSTIDSNNLASDTLMQNSHYSFQPYYT